MRYRPMKPTFAAEMCIRDRGQRMNILAVDTAGKTLGVALLQDYRLKDECYLDGGMTRCV